MAADLPLEMGGTFSIFAYVEDETDFGHSELHTIPTIYISRSVFFIKRQIETSIFIFTKLYRYASFRNKTAVY